MTTQQIRSGQILDGTIVNVDVAAAAAIAWSKIDKTGALLADLGGAISWAQLPSGAGTWNGAPTLNGILTIGAGYRIRLAAGGDLYLDADVAMHLNTISGASVINIGSYLNIRPAAIGNALCVFGYGGSLYASMGLGGAIKGDGSTDLAFFANPGAGVAFMVNGSAADAFKINSSSYWLRGTSLMDGTGTPTIASGGGSGATIAGRTYAFVITIGSSPGNADIAVNFGRTFANIPIVVASYTSGGIVYLLCVSTTAVTFGISIAASWTVGHKISVLVRGY